MEGGDSPNVTCCFNSVNLLSKAHLYRSCAFCVVDFVVFFVLANPPRPPPPTKPILPLVVQPALVPIRNHFLCPSHSSMSMRVSLFFLFCLFRLLTVGSICVFHFVSNIDTHTHTHRHTDGVFDKEGETQWNWSSNQSTSQPKNP